jgi:hypothetical protein
LRHEAWLVLVQSARRGALHEETIDTITIPITQKTLKPFYDSAATCPDRTRFDCPCPWHAANRAEEIIKNKESLRRQPDEPYIVEDTSEESSVYHYGKSF